MKTHNDETIKDRDLPEVVQWNNILDRPFSLADLNIQDGEKLDSALDGTDVGDMAYEDAVEKAKLGETIVEGGYLKTDLLDVDDIFAQTITATGTITGATIQTAKLGKRLKMQGSPANEYQFLDGSTKVGHLKIDDDGGGGYFAELYIDHLGSTLKVGSTVGAAESVYFSAPFISTTGRAAVGNVNIGWDDRANIKANWTGGGYYGEAKFVGNMIDGPTTLNAEAGLTWSGGTPTWSFYLGDNFVKLSSDIDMNNNAITDASGVYSNYIRSYGDIRADDNLTVYGNTTLNILGASGAVVFSNLPTSDPGVSGQLYKDGDYVKIS